MCKSQSSLTNRICHLSRTWRLGKVHIGLTSLGWAVCVGPGIGMEIGEDAVRVASGELTS